MFKDNFLYRSVNFLISDIPNVQLLLKADELGALQVDDIPVAIMEIGCLVKFGVSNFSLQPPCPNLVTPAPATLKVQIPCGRKIYLTVLIVTASDQTSSSFCLHDSL